MNCSSFVGPRLRLSLRALAACLPASAAVLLAASSAAAEQAARPAGQLNDTGKIRCYEPKWNGMEIDCAGTGQDGEFGRDVTEPKRGDGYAGFSYTKIGSAGEHLPRSATEWACVHDRITRLTWEVKTADGGLRDWQRVYTHHGNGAPTDVSGLVNEVNAAGLCGHHDWRLPGRMELQSLVNYGHQPAPMIINRWFPNTSADAYWTSTRDAPDIFGGFWIVSFLYGVSVGGGDNSNGNPARLVRGEPFHRGDRDGRYVLDGDKATDVRTGLVWRRCSEGAAWNGSTCVGTPASVNWKEALTLAKKARYDDAAWRLPNATELFSLVDETRHNPAIDPQAFPDMPQMFLLGFWSATPGVPSGDFGGIFDAYEVDFFSGSLGRNAPDSTQRAVRLVRVGAH